jgi:hypothetical protein
MYVLSVRTALDIIFTITFVGPLVWNKVPFLFNFIDPHNEVFIFIVIRKIL